MGLNYEYVLVIPIENKDKLISFINKHGLFQDSCSSIRSEIDSAIFKYFEGGYSFYPQYDCEEINHHIVSNNMVEIGEFDYREIYIEDNSSDIIVAFTAVASEMSLLIKDSNSIKRWFIELSKYVDSIITYLDLESEGHRIIYYRGIETFLEFKGEWFFSLGKSKFKDVMNDFSKYLENIVSDYNTTHRFEFKYFMVIKKEHRIKLENYINKYGHIDNSRITLLLDLDSTLFKYLEDGYGESEYGLSSGPIPCFKRERIERHIEPDNKFKLKNVSFSVSESKDESNNLYVSFIPERFKVDTLFGESLSIRNWFVELSKEVDSQITFIGTWTEGYGHRIIYFKGQEMNVEFTGHLDIEKNLLNNICSDFSQYLSHYQVED